MVRAVGHVVVATRASAPRSAPGALEDGLVSAVEWWVQWGNLLAELEEPEPGRTVIVASELDFTETGPPTPVTGQPSRIGHYYAWGRCRRCGELRLTERAGLTGKRCAMTPGCPGRLERAEDAQDLTAEVALTRARRAFGDVEVIS